MDFSSIILELAKGIDNKALLIDAGLLGLLIRQHLVHVNKISQLESQIAILKENARHSERDIDSLETMYNEDVRKVFLRFSEGRIYNS